MPEREPSESLCRGCMVLTDAAWVHACSSERFLMNAHVGSMYCSKMQEVVYVSIAKAPFKLVEQGFRVAK